jgi:hypothetical protein
MGLRYMPTQIPPSAPISANPFLDQVRVPFNAFKGIFQKRSKHGIATPRSAIELVNHRHAMARGHYALHYPEQV